MVKDVNKKKAKAVKSFSDEEREAMRERFKELNSENGEKAVLEKIKTMSGSDKVMAEKVHRLVKTNAPELSPRLWYGMPAYAKGDKIIIFFQDAAKFKARYATLGFSDKANLDEGQMWPNSYALKGLTSKEETKIVALLKKAVS